MSTVKVLTWFSRRPGMSLDDFRSYWRNEHPKAVLRLPGLVAYNQNPTADSGYRRGQPLCDGVAETWWESLDAVRSHRGTAELDALMADEEEFIDPDRRHGMVVDEVVITDRTPGPGALKQFSWLKRRPDLTAEECHRYWRDQHGPLAATVPGMTRYVQNRAAPQNYREGRSPLYDGVAVAHLADLETARAGASSAEWAATRADEANFLSPEPLEWIIADEFVIL